MSYSVVDNEYDIEAGEEDIEIEEDLPNRCESERQCCRKHATVSNIICFIVLVQVIFLIFWLMNYDVTGYFPIDDGSMSGSGSYGMSSSDPVPTISPKPESIDFSQVLDRYSLRTEKTEDNGNHYYNPPSVGQSADEFIQFLGMVIFIYLCIRCTCGRDPYRK